MDRVVTPPDWVTYAPYVRAINELKKIRNAVILGHNYMTPEIYHGVSDFVGDSLQIAMKAQEVDADVIVQAGVHFMAETSKILSPEKTVLMPDMEAGCSLAESITADGIENRALQRMAVSDLSQPRGGLTNKKFLEELLWPRDRRHTRPAASPAHLASTMDSPFRADRERGKAGASAHGLSGELVETDIPVGAALGVHFQDSGKEAVNGEVTSFDPVVKASVESELVTHRIERLEKTRQLIVTSFGFRKEAIQLVSQ